jgi:hypothetical protein
VAVRLGEDPKLCLLVVIGVREDGAKELLAVEDGYRESADSWAAVLGDLKDRGLGCPRLRHGRWRARRVGRAARRVPRRRRADQRTLDDRRRLLSHPDEDV